MVDGVPRALRRAVPVAAGLAVLACVLAATASRAQDAPADLTDVVMVPREGAVEVWVRLSRPVAPTTAVFDRPWRLVLDFEGTRYRWKGGPLAVSQEPLRAIRGSQFRKDMARVVVELTTKADYTIDQDREGLRIVFPAR